ncbi:hypothetical protein [Hymenobacter siberiensis]|uniref:hypothetical protein n=1 Tax=Hymenobacter siberiensis TaxID=2848396 RepID=UPI001C1E40ED|nr:hypothetical protein [Hymenobacter siberiensis]MBU6119412.1 hypothetical protein [Hymenobacter siberiensis]
MRFLRLGGLLLLGLGRATAQDIPVYPPPAPLDTMGLGRTDGQTFANSQVVGMGPSKGLIIKHERIPGNFTLRSSAVGGVGDYRTEVSKNANLVIKAYAPLLNHPHLKLILGLNYDRQEFQFSPPRHHRPVRPLQQHREQGPERDWRAAGRDSARGRGALVPVPRQNRAQRRLQFRRA